MMYAHDNGWFPNGDQYRIVWKKGTHHVITYDTSCDEEKEVFTGWYEKCLDYVENQYISQLEAMIG